MSTAEMLPSTQRPIPLRVRPDLVVAVNDFQGIAYWVVKDPVALKYHRLRGEQYIVMSLLNLKRSLEEIREELIRRMPTMHLTLGDIQSLITDLHKKGLVQSDRFGQAPGLLKQKQQERRQKLLGVFRNLLYLRLPGWDPERTLQWMYPWLSWLFRPWAVTSCLTLVLASWLLVAIRFDVVQSRLPEFEQFFGWPNIMLLWLTLGLAKIIHEFGHGLSCTHYGGECHEMGVMLLVFSPCLYCDVSDSWMLRNKWQRIMIAAAGMYIEVILSAIAIFVWWNTRPGVVHHLAMNLFFVTTISTVIFNANPLMRFDGYYMMSDLLEIPNLRTKSDKLVREAFGWYCLGIEPRHDPFMPETGRHWFVLYAIAAWLYRWVILFSITLFLYTVLEPYGLQAIGIFMVVMSIGGIFVSMFVNLYRMISAPREEPMSRVKTSLTVGALVAAAAMALAIPVPWHLESSFVVEPLDAQSVYNLTPGYLQRFEVQPGDDVEAGQVLAWLSNPELEDERLRLLNQIEVQQIDVNLQRALDAQMQLELSQQRLDNLAAQLQDLEARIGDLCIRAPIAGRVIEAPRQDAPDIDDLKRGLPIWYGVPTESRNAGAFFEERTHLLTIAPRAAAEAVLLVDQSNRNFMREELPVELKFEHLPARTYDGTISSIAERHSEYAPQAMSNKLGGSESTVTDEQGREKLASTAYHATVELPEDPELLVPGLRGKARITVVERTVGDWAWRYLRQTLHFKL